MFFSGIQWTNFSLIFHKHTTNRNFGLFKFVFNFYALFFQSTKSDHDKKLRSLTQMLLGIGILFLICESPRAIMPIYHKFHQKNLKTRIINSVTYIISGINHACNFFIYVLKGERFREVLFEVLPCCMKMSRRSADHSEMFGSGLSASTCVGRGDLKSISVDT